MKQLSPMDAVFLYNEQPNTPMHGSTLLIYDPSTTPNGFVRFKEILAHFESRLHLSPIFRRKLVRVPFDLDNPYWVEDESFDIEFHVRHIALPKPGDWRQLCILVSRIHGRRLDLSRPPWEVYIIEGLDNIDGLPPGSFGLLLRSHHCAVDGATQTHILDALHDPSTKSQYKGADTWRSEKDPGQLDMLTKAYFNFLKHPSKVVRAAKTIYRSRQIESDAKSEESFSPIRFNEPLGPHRVFGGVSFELDRVKAIKNKVEGTTINDVVLAIMGGALRTYLGSTNELPDTSLVAAVPINTRSEGQETAEGGNEVAAMMISLCTDVTDPLQRLKQIHKDAIASKSYANAVGADLMVNVAESLPSVLASYGLRAAAAANVFSRFPWCHTAITNVPGLQKPIYMCGAELVGLYGAGCPLEGTGLFNAVMSYNGKVSITFTTDRDMMPDPEFYQQCITESLDALEKTVVKKPAPRKKKSSRPKRATAKSA